MELIPLEEEDLPQEYFQHKLEIECMSGWEMSKLMHKIDARCADNTGLQYAYTDYEGKPCRLTSKPEVLHAELHFETCKIT